LATVLALDLAMVVALIVVGVRAHSLAVLAEGADYIADAAGAALCLLALWLAAREPSERHPDGFPRATSFAALANAASLLAISVAVAVGAGYRLLTGAVEVSGRPVVIVSGIAAVVMAAAVIVLRGEADDDDSGDALAMRAVLLDTIADVASAAGVAVVGVIMAVTHGWFWLDAAVALVVSLVVGSHAAALVRTVTTTLRAGGEAARAE
jgi:cobalt-zinc-cadmium efflux system protein